MDYIIDCLKCFISLLFPKFCIACNEELSLKDHSFCLSCFSRIPFTFHFDTEASDLSDRLVGRVNFKYAKALLYYQKGNLTQKVLYNLKYKGQGNIGFELGVMFGKKWSSLNIEHTFDYIIPIPIHKRKQKLRGYNQAEKFASGIKEHLNIPIEINNLIKQTESDSQTLKSRAQRLHNVAHSFMVKNPKRFEKKHVLIVDDVLTTSATMEAAYLKLKEIKGITISIGLIALAEY